MGMKYDRWILSGKSTGFMVAVKGSGAPTYVHDTQDDAVKEAERLLDGLPDNKDQTAFILRLTGTVFRGKATRPAPEVATFPDELSVKFTQPAPVSSAPKFKPGDRVYYDSAHTDRRVYGTVVPAKEWPLFGKAALPDQNPVFARWDKPGNVHWMPADRVFPDLRTIAGCGILTLEAGRKGKTRDGRIVGPFCPHENVTFPWRGMTGSGMFFTLADSGHHYGPHRSSNVDIVELLPEGA